MTFFHILQALLIIYGKAMTFSSCDCGGTFILPWIHASLVRF